MFGAWRSFSDVSQLLFQQGTAKINCTPEMPLRRQGTAERKWRYLISASTERRCGRINTPDTPFEHNVPFELPKLEQVENQSR
jgi:hypothetical protein